MAQYRVGPDARSHPHYETSALPLYRNLGFEDGDAGSKARVLADGCYAVYKS